MNAGAYGGEIAQRLVKCELLDENGNIFTADNPFMTFGYRKSILEDKNIILLSATFECETGDKSEIRARMDELMAKRKTSQPLEYPSCGSAFKRPAGHYAGALIEQCGLKGYSIGGAKVSEKHAGFIINTGGATAEDVKALVCLVRDEVEKLYRYRLECEIRLVVDGINDTDTW